MEKLAIRPTDLVNSRYAEIGVMVEADDFE